VVSIVASYYDRVKTFECKVGIVTLERKLRKPITTADSSYNTINVIEYASLMSRNAVPTFLQAIARAAMSLSAPANRHCRVIHSALVDTACLSKFHCPSPNLNSSKIPTGSIPRTESRFFPAHLENLKFSPPSNRENRTVSTN
jgi:hypothetical protein